MHTEVQQKSWASSWVNFADFPGFESEVVHDFLGADVKLSAVLTEPTSVSGVTWSKVTMLPIAEWHRGSFMESSGTMARRRKRWKRNLGEK